MRMPIPVVPPSIQPERHQSLQILLAVCDLFGCKYLGAVYGFGMIVKHDFNVTAVRKIDKALHIGKQFFVNFVSPAVFGRAPVGIEHHIIERNIIPFIVRNQLFRLLFVIGVIFGIPSPERRKTDKFASSRKLRVESA